MISRAAQENPSCASDRLIRAEGLAHRDRQSRWAVTKRKPSKGKKSLRRALVAVWPSLVRDVWVGVMESLLVLLNGLRELQ